jgi:hypothetical protein
VRSTAQYLQAKPVVRRNRFRSRAAGSEMVLVSDRDRVVAKHARSLIPPGPARALEMKIVGWLKPRRPRFAAKPLDKQYAIWHSCPEQIPNERGLRCLNQACRLSPPPFR